MATTQKTIFIVEDEEAIRRVIRDALVKKGFNVLEASNGAEALELVKTNCPDLILLDVLMPRMHGVEVVTKLRLDVSTKDVPIILLTNFAEDPKVQQMVSEGHCELLIKGKTSLEALTKLLAAKLGVPQG